MTDIWMYFFYAALCRGNHSEKFSNPNMLRQDSQKKSFVFLTSYAEVVVSQALAQSQHYHDPLIQI